MYARRTIQQLAAATVVGAFALAGSSPALAHHSANAVYKGTVDNPGGAADGTVEFKVTAGGTAIEYFKVDGISTGCGQTNDTFGTPNVPIAAHEFKSGTGALPYFGTFYARMRASGEIHHIIQGCQTEVFFNASTTTPPAACMDEEDNDGDFFIDSVDPGCSGPLDTDESNPSLFSDDEDPADARPVLSGLAVKRGGRRIVYRLSEPAEVVFKVARRVRGRYRAVRGALHHYGRRGVNSVRLGRRIGTMKLRRGRYRLTAVPKDGGGQRGGAVQARFRIRR